MWVYDIASARGDFSQFFSFEPKNSVLRPPLHGPLCNHLSTGLSQHFMLPSTEYIISLIIAPSSILWTFWRYLINSELLSTFFAKMHSNNGTPVASVQLTGHLTSPSPSRLSGEKPCSSFSARSCLGQRKSVANWWSGETFYGEEKIKKRIHRETWGNSMKFLLLVFTFEFFQRLWVAQEMTEATFRAVDRARCSAWLEPSRLSSSAQLGGTNQRVGTRWDQSTKTKRGSSPNQH